MVGVEPAALNGNGVGVNIWSDHLELARPEGRQLSNEVLVATAFLEQVPNLLNVLWLGEPSDERRVGLREDFVIHVTHVLRRQNAGYPVFSGLLEDEFDEVFGGWIARMRREVRRHLIHEEQQFQLPIRWLLREHPVVEFSGKLLNEVLLLIFILNGVQIDDVQGNFPRDCRLDERIDVDGNAIGKQQLIHARGKGCEATGEVVARGFWQAFLKIRQAMFNHHFVPGGRVHTVFLIL